MNHQILTITTREKTQFIDITKMTSDFVRKQNVKNGIISIQSLHTTTSIIINENETGLLYDLDKLLTNLCPENMPYSHDDFSRRERESGKKIECKKNGFAHLKAMLLGNGITLPIINHKLSLGTWQSILFLEFDGPQQERKIELCVYNEQDDT